MGKRGYIYSAKSPMKICIARKIVNWKSNIVLDFSRKTYNITFSESEVYRNFDKEGSTTFPFADAHFIYIVEVVDLVEVVDIYEKYLASFFLKHETLYGCLDITTKGKILCDSRKLSIHLFLMHNS